jgi:hypothetical protein
MNNLIQTIEELDPGHFARREVRLNNLREKFIDLGFSPLPISQDDIECLGVTFRKTNGGTTFFTRELLEDSLEYNDLMEAMKELLEYDSRTI